MFQLNLCSFLHTMNNSTEGGTAPPTAVHRLPRSQGIAYAAAFAVEALFTIIGNLVVLAVFGKNSQLRQRKSHWLLVNQAAVDLLVGFIIPPCLYFVAKDFDLWKYYPDHHGIVVSVDSFLIFATFASIFNLLMIALERAYLTLRPMNHRTLSPINYRLVIVVVWLLPVPLVCLSVAERLEIFSYLFLHITPSRQPTDVVFSCSSSSAMLVFGSDSSAVPLLLKMT